MLKLAYHGIKSRHCVDKLSRWHYYKYFGSRCVVWAHYWLQILNLCIFYCETKPVTRNCGFVVFSTLLLLQT